MCPPTVHEIKNEKKNKGKKGKKKKKKGTGHGHFCPLSSLIFSLQFSLHFREKTFWWAWEENTQAPPFIFLPPHLTKHI